MTPAVLGTPGALGLRLGQPTEASRVSEHPFVKGPQPAGTYERLVIEARRRERPSDRVGDLHHVELQARGGVQMLNLHPLANRLGAGANPRSAVDRHEAVRAVPGTAHQSAATVVLEAPGESPPARGVKRGTDRVARERGDLPPVERERHLRIAIDDLTRLRW